MKDIVSFWLTIINSGLIWKLLFFSMILYFFLVIRKLQRITGNNVDFLEILRDNVTNKFSHIRVAYMIALIATTYVYIIVCTRVGVTPEQVGQLTLVYLGAFVLSQAANKLAERPPAPAGTTTIIQQPGGQANLNNPTPPPPE